MLEPKLRLLTYSFLPTQFATVRVAPNISTQKREMIIQSTTLFQILDLMKILSLPLLIWKLRKKNFFHLMMLLNSNKKKLKHSRKELEKKKWN